MTVKRLGNCSDSDESSTLTVKSALSDNDKKLFSLSDQNVNA